MLIEIYNNNRIDLNIKIYKEYVDYTKQNYDINSIKKIDDNTLKNIYNGAFLKFGIISEYFINNKLDNEQLYFLKKMDNYDYNFLKNNNLMDANKFLDKINILIKNCINYFNCINDNIDNINIIEKKIINNQNLLIKKNLENYLDKFKKINISLELINCIKNNLYQDFNILYIKLYDLKFKILYENNIVNIFKYYLELLDFYNNIKINIYYIDNGFKEEFSISNGKINIDLIINKINENLNCDNFILSA